MKYSCFKRKQQNVFFEQESRGVLSVIYKKNKVRVQIIYLFE